jgi:hypothetical protein
MMDEERQARILRDRLDAELASVRATEQARQSLWRRSAGRGEVHPGLDAERLGGPAPAGGPEMIRRPHRGPRGRGLLVPVAATAIVVSVIAVPTLLRSAADRENPGVPPAGSVSAPASVPTPVAESSRPAGPSTGPAPAASGAGESRPGAAPEVRVGETSVTVRGDQKITVTVTGYPSLPGDLSLEWGDGSSPYASSVGCSRKNTRTVTHEYTEAGTFRVVASLRGCGSEKAVRVVVSATAARTGAR